jgi:hypothetical protein
MGEYIPGAPANDEARKRNGNLPGMGGVFNTVNLHVYHYAGNNPVKLVDPDGRNIDDLTPTSSPARIRYEERQATQNTQPQTQLALLKQNSTELSGIPNMAAYGCYFRAAQAIAEFYVGTALTAEQIQSSVTALQSTPNPARPGTNVITDEFHVNNPDLVINDAFVRLGRPDITATVGWGGTLGQQDYIIQVGDVPSADQHYKLLDNSGDLLWDPNDPAIMIINTSNRNVYLRTE